MSLKLTGQTSMVFLTFKFMYCLKEDFLKQQAVYNLLGLKEDFFSSILLSTLPGPLFKLNAPMERVS